MAPLTVLRAVVFALSLAAANAVTVNETSTLYTFANNRISFNVLKTNGYIRNLLFEGISVLGTASGSAGQLYTGQHDEAHTNAHAEAASAQIFLQMLLL